MDAFNFANSIVSFVFGFITSGIMTIVLPEYVKNPKEKKINAFISFVYAIVILLIAIIFVLRYQILSLATNRDELFIGLASSALGVLLVSNSISSISSLAIAYSQSRGNFVTPKVISLISQLLILSSLILIRDNITIYLYALIISCGLIFDSSLNIFLSIRHGWRFYPTFSIKNKETRELISRFLPLVFSAGVYQVSLFVDSIIATSLEVGKITILGYSSQIVGMINSVIIANLTAYFYPRIIKRVSEGAKQEYFWNLTGILHLLTCLLICGFLTIGNEGITLIFQHGMFDKHITNMVFYGASIYMIGQQVNIVRDLIYKYFYANGNTKTPVKNSVIISAMNIIISIILVRYIGFYGIIIGTVCSSIISLIVILIRFNHFYVLQVPFKSILTMYMRDIIVSFLSVVSVLIVKKYISLHNIILEIVVYGFITLLCFGLFSLLLCRQLLTSYKKINN